MSHPAPHTDFEDGFALKPRPCVSSRAAPSGIGGSSLPSSKPPTPPAESIAPTHAFPNESRKLESLRTANMAEINGSTTPAKTRSFLNLTSSTLFGIYQPSGLETENPTPTGFGAQTPSAAQTPASDTRHASFDWSRISLPTTAFQNTTDERVRRRSTAPQLQTTRTIRQGFRGYYLPLLGRLSALFSVGVLYGLFISHLHDRQQIAPAIINLDRTTWTYLATWGTIGLLLGEALPYADKLFQSRAESAESEEGPKEEIARFEQRKARRAGGWVDVVRSIGAFVGIAFAIRKLPWQSMLQLSLTLALANPALWYLIDRSSAGFVLSTIVALSGTALLLGVNSALAPPSSSAGVLQEHLARTGGVINGSIQALLNRGNSEHVLGIFSQESVGVATWIASVLFVSSVCFGNIGRRLSAEVEGKAVCRRR